MSSSNQRYVAFIIATLFYAFVLLTRNLPVIVPDILCQKFHMSEAIFGQYRGLYYLTYCMAHLPMAYALDRFGPRLVMTLSLLLCVVGLAPMLWSESTSLLITGRMLLGIGASTGILSVFKINRAFFEPKQFAILLGIAGTSGYIASIAGLGPLQTLFTTVGFEKTLASILIVGVVLALCSFVFIRSVKSDAPQGFSRSLKELALNKSFWIVALVGGLMIWGTEGFADGWSVPLLTSLFKWDLPKAVYVTSIILVGFALGSIGLPLLAKKFENTKQLFGLAGVISAVCLVLLFVPGLSSAFVFILYLMIGFMAAYQVICIDLSGRVVPAALSTLASAAMNMLIMSFGYVFHTISAILMNGKGVIDATCGRVVYSSSDLLIGLSPFIVCGVIAYIINVRSTYDQN
jgi:predicted MFS family arabinose efflux permease